MPKLSLRAGRRVTGSRCRTCDLAQPRQPCGHSTRRLMIANLAAVTSATDLPTMRDLVDDLRDRLARARQGGSESARAKHTARGKLLVRDRVDRVLDPGSPFLELSPLAAFGMYAAGDDYAVPSA